MTGINEHAVQARAVLNCDRCGDKWQSPVYESKRWGDEVRACRPAWLLGWRVFAGGRNQRTYCPGCEPTVPMHLVHPGSRDSTLTEQETR